MIQTAEQESIELAAAHAALNRTFARRVYRSRGAFVAPAIIAAAVAAWTASPRALDLAIGGGMFLVGWLGRMWSQRHLGYRLRQRMRLTTCGPYRLMRNPIYVANTFVVTGTTLMTGSHWLTAASALLCAVVYGLTVRHEEAYLTRWYGRPYLAYRRATPRWLPVVPAASGEERCGCARSWTSILAAEWHVALIPIPVLIPLILR